MRSSEVMGPLSLYLSLALSLPRSLSLSLRRSLSLSFSRSFVLSERVMAEREERVGFVDTLYLNFSLLRSCFQGGPPLHIESTSQAPWSLVSYRSYYSFSWLRGRPLCKQK